MKKKVVKINLAREKHWVGDGFHVSTLFSPHTDDYKMTTPFIMMDYAQPKNFEPSNVKRGVREHPHRGFETVTFAIQGEISHRDSSGGGGTISQGGVQWMTAASGVVHEEFHSQEFTQKGGMMQMVQLWVNLPAQNKMDPPRYQSFDKENFVNVNLSDHSHARIIAGSLKDQKSAMKTFTPMNIYEIESSQEDFIELFFENGTNTLIIEQKNACRVNDEDLEMGSIAFLSREGEKVQIQTQKDSHILVMNAQPIDEPIVAYGPFVMNTQDEIVQAINDFNAGKMGQLVKEANNS